MTKILHASILLDETTAAVVRRRLPADVARLRRLATVRPYGMDTPVTVSELLPPVSEYSRLTDQHLAAYESAVDAVTLGRWSEAIELLHQVPADDLAKDFLTMYIVGHNRTPPPDWDGVIPLTSKG
jgi:adenylate cyclase